MGSSPIVPTKPSIAYLCFGRFLLFLRPLLRPLAPSLVSSAFLPCLVPSRSLFRPSSSLASSLVRPSVLFVAIYRDAPPLLPLLSLLPRSFPQHFLLLPALCQEKTVTLHLPSSPRPMSLFFSPPRLADGLESNQPAKHAKAYARTKKYRAPPQKGFHTH